MFLRLTVWKFEELVARVPKFIDAGAACSAGDAFSPVPESATLSGVFRWALVMVNAPATEVVEVGQKATLMVALPPGASETGCFAEESRKPAPEMWMEFRSTRLALMLVSVTVCEFF